MKRATHFYGLSIMDFAVIGITHFYKSIFLVDFLTAKYTVYSWLIVNKHMNRLLKAMILQLKVLLVQGENLTQYLKLRRATE